MKWSCTNLNERFRNCDFVFPYLYRSMSRWKEWMNGNIVHQKRDDNHEETETNYIHEALKLYLKERSFGEE